MTVDADLISAIAAVIAAVASGYTAVSHWRTKNREIYISKLYDHLGSIGEATHEVMCVADTTSKKIASGKLKIGKDIGEEGKKAEKSVQALGTLKATTRYLLPGFDEGFRQLIRINSYLTHCPDNPERARDIVRLGNAVRSSMDLAISEAMRTGKPPSTTRLNQIAETSLQLKNYFESSK